MLHFFKYVGRVLTGLLVFLTAALPWLKPESLDTSSVVFFAVLYILASASIAYSSQAALEGKAIGHKAFPASLVAFLLVSLMVYHWWQSLGLAP